MDVAKAASPYDEPFNSIRNLFLAHQRPSVCSTRGPSATRLYIHLRPHRRRPSSSVRSRRDVARLCRQSSANRVHAAWLPVRREGTSSSNNSHSDNKLYPWRSVSFLCVVSVGPRGTAAIIHVWHRSSGGIPTWCQAQRASRSTVSLWVCRHH